MDINRKTFLLLGSLIQYRRKQIILGLGVDSSSIILLDTLIRGIKVSEQLYIDTGDETYKVQKEDFEALSNKLLRSCGELCKNYSIMDVEGNCTYPDFPTPTPIPPIPPIVMKIEVAHILTTEVFTDIANFPTVTTDAMGLCVILDTAGVWTLYRQESTAWVVFEEDVENMNLLLVDQVTMQISEYSVRKSGTEVFYLYEEEDTIFRDAKKGVRADFVGGGVVDAKINGTAPRCIEVGISPSAYNLRSSWLDAEGNSIVTNEEGTPEIGGGYFHYVAATGTSPMVTLRISLSYYLSDTEIANLSSFIISNGDYDKDVEYGASTHLLPGASFLIFPDYTQCKRLHEKSIDLAVSGDFREQFQSSDTSTTPNTEANTDKYLQNEIYANVEQSYYDIPQLSGYFSTPDNIISERYLGAFLGLPQMYFTSGAIVNDYLELYFHSTSFAYTSKMYSTTKVADKLYIYLP